MNSTIKKTTLFLGACMAFQLGGIPQMLAAPSTSMEVMQQTKRITGTVKDATGMEVIGANVIVKGTTNGVITDLDGKFSLEAAPGSIIEISYIGYMTQEIPVTAQTSDLQITLKEDSQSLDEVVVVGYGVQKKKLVTGATLQVKGENIQKLNTTNPLGALQSQSPGVNIVANSGQPGKSFDINIRGAGTNGSTTPLYIIDGVEGDINSLSPADIESLDVLKDAASAAIYGSRAANGVVLITTKQGKQGKLQVSYDGYVGFQNVYKMPDLLNAKEYMAVMDQLNFNTGNQPYTWTNYMSQEQYNRYMSGEDEGTNWLDAIRNKNAITTSHSLNLAGGTERSKFSTGVSYTKQEGTLGKPVASDYQRFTVRMNSEHILWKEGDLDIITFGENLYYNHNESSGISEGNQYGNDISWMLRANPLVPIYNENGDYYMYDDLNKASWNTTIAFANGYALHFGLRGDQDVANTFPFGQGWGAGPVAPNFVNDWASAEPNDMRRDASVYRTDKLPAYNKGGWADFVQETDYYAMKWSPVACKTSNDESGYFKTFENEMYGIDGWTQGANNQALDNIHDLVLIRFADVLLMQSELKGDATGMNKVRERAGLPAIGYSLQALQNERRWELALEGTRWNDIRRWHIAAAALQKQIGTPIYIAGNPATNKAQNGGYASRYNTSAGFMKIPESQISLSSELQQNEGWGADAEYNGWTN